MPYTNIVFVKLEKRLLNDHRWFMMSESAQLIYIKLILLAAETNNKIPKNNPNMRIFAPDMRFENKALRQALRSKLDPSEFNKCIEEIKNNFPKFLSNKHYYYFKDFHLFK